MELLAAAARLAGTQQVDRGKPFGEGNLAALKDAADSYGELFAAVLALPQAGAVSLTLELVVIANRATVRAGDAVRPAQGFEVLAGLSVVAEVVGDAGREISP